jgi:hypothetical protein
MEAVNTMPFHLIREMTQGPPEDRAWRFRVMRTQGGSDVVEEFDIALPNDLVAKIYDDEVGSPATRIELDDVLDNWDALVPRLRDEIEYRMPPES